MLFVRLQDLSFCCLFRVTCSLKTLFFVVQKTCFSSCEMTCLVEGKHVLFARWVHMPCILRCYVLCPLCIIIINHFCIALFSALEQTRCAHVGCDSEWVTIHLWRVVLISTEVMYWQRCLVVAWLGASFLCTIQTCTTLQCHFIQSHIGRVYACLAATCHLHFWQNDRDSSGATAYSCRVCFAG